jgi:regulator of protease activity HflC (stomatin/prohibitin superfamily)
MRTIIIVLAAIVALSSCRTIRQGTVGVKRTVGKINEKPLMPGARLFNPFVSMIMVVPVRTENIEVALELPSKEGLNVKSVISILYRVQEQKATEVIANIGPNYEAVVILPVFRAVASDVSAKHMAKDLHTGNRAEIEQEIRDRMMSHLGNRGFEIEAVLLKNIQLPPGLYRAIEDKLEAEQVAQRMEFVLQRELQEAERRRLEAEGIRDANRIISEGLTPEVLQFKAIEAYRELSKSPNAKLIIGTGKEPMIITP